jgi:hypothetical protein
VASDWSLVATGRVFSLWSLKRKDLWPFVLPSKGTLQPVTYLVRDRVASATNCFFCWKDFSIVYSRDVRSLRLASGRIGFVDHTEVSGKTASDHLILEFISSVKLAG